MNNDPLEEAKKRMIAGRKAREARRLKARSLDIKEPKHLVSGEFDEVELKREEKEEQQHEKTRTKQ